MAPGSGWPATVAEVGRPEQLRSGRAGPDVERQLIRIRQTFNGRRSNGPQNTLWSAGRFEIVDETVESLTCSASAAMSAARSDSDSISVGRKLSTTNGAADQLQLLELLIRVLLSIGTANEQPLGGRPANEQLRP